MTNPLGVDETIEPSAFEDSVRCVTCGNAFFQTKDPVPGNKLDPPDQCGPCWALANPRRDRLDYYRVRSGALPA